jgi:hypothetical protein
MTYHETVRAADIIRVTAWLSGGIAVFIGTWAFLFADDEAGRWVLTVALLVSGVLLLAVARWLTLLHIHVSGEVLSFRFGPFRRHIPLSQIERIAVTPYPWTRYGGWGIRMARGKRRAFSMPFVRTGIELTVSDGKTYYLSSRNPQALAAAIESGVAGRES